MVRYLFHAKDTVAISGEHIRALSDKQQQHDFKEHLSFWIKYQNKLKGNLTNLYNWS